MYKIYRIIFLVLFIISAVTSVARVSFYPNGDEYTPSPDMQYVPEVAKFESDVQLDEWRGRGVIILRTRGDIALCYVPVGTSLQSMPARSRRYRSGLKPRNVPALDVARTMYGAQKIMSGEGFDKAYKGSGVVVGLCDIGFDPSHPAFLNAEGSETRIKRITQYIEEEGRRLVMETPEDFAEWETDTKEHTHGTHVANILCGAYSADGYQGIAQDADLVVSVSQLSDVGLLAGAEDILDYAKQQGKPCVINLSMGNYIGPHDGTSLFSQYIDMMGREAIICLSSGNEGNSAVSLQTRIDDDSFPDAKFRLGSLGHWDQFNIIGYTDIWGEDSRSLTITPVVYDENTGSVVHELATVTMEDSDIWGVATSDPLGYETLDKEFAGYFTGWINARCSLNPDNNRMNIMLSYDLKTEEYRAGQKWARYTIGVRVGSGKGNLISVYADAMTTRLLDWYHAGQKPGHVMSISDLATGHNLISVGMYDSRGEYPTIGYGIVQASNPAGIVNPHSSYGTLADGRVLPLTVAPGSEVVSAGNYYYVRQDEERYKRAAAEGVYDGRDVYYVVDIGTSMASPYVAGFIACWLEANPLLKVEDVKKIIAETNHKDVPDPGNPRHGQGWFDPVRGMEAVLRGVDTGSVGAVMPVHPRPEITFRGGVCNVIMPGSSIGEVYVYAADGTLCLQNRISGKHTLNLDKLAPGAYVVKAIQKSGASSVMKIVRGNSLR